MGYILIAILIFSVIVTIHELGHFSLAKANGIEVTEFSLGMGPRIITLIKTAEKVHIKLFATTNQLEARPDFQGRTWYSIKCLPFGGSCMMLGEDEENDSENSFNKKSVYARMSVIFAGPLFNFVLAFLLALIVIGLNGYDPATIGGITKGSAMEAAGFQKGDVVTEINGKSVDISRELAVYLQFHPLDGSNVSITVNRNGKEIQKNIKPLLTTVESTNAKTTQPQKVYRLGLEYSNQRIKTSPLETLKYSAIEVKFWIATTVDSLGYLIRGKVSTKEISGPVGIVSIIKDGAQESQKVGVLTVITFLLNISILISANLGVMNLLPIPALDGGRLLFLIIEWIRRKPINPKFEGAVNFVGFMALMLLMVVVMFNDIVKLF